MEIKIGKREVRYIFLFVLLAIIFYWVLHETERLQSAWVFVASIFAPFFAGAAMAFVLNVPVRAFEKRLTFLSKQSLRRIFAILLSLLSLVLVIAAVIWLLVPQITETVGMLVEQLPSFFAKVNEKLMELFEEFPELEELLGLNLAAGGVEWMKLVEKVMSALETSISSILGGAVSFVSNFASAIFNAVVSVVFAFYCLTQKEELARHGRRLVYAIFKTRYADELIRIARMTNTVFSNFITGQCLEAVILGLLFVPAMAIFRMPYIPLICVVISVTALVPLVGAFAGCVLGAFFILVNNPIQAVTFVIMFLVIQQFEGNVIYPRVVGKSVGLPSMWVLLAVSVGGGLMGVTGMLVMVPFASVVYTLLKEYTGRRLEQRQIPEEKLVIQMPELQPHFMFKFNKPKSKKKTKTK